MYYSDQQPSQQQQYGRMVSPSFIQQQMRNPSQPRGRVAASNKYSKIYERALQDKVKYNMFKQHQQQQQFQPNPNLTKRTPSSASIQSSISTLELIQYVLREYEQENPVTMQIPTAVKSSYTIYEDLKIIASLSQESNISAGSFKRLSDEGIVTRTPDSIRSRYQDFLKNLTKDDYQNIISFIDSNGLRGYLVFEKSNDNIRLLHAISKTDPRLIQLENNSSNRISTPLRSPRIPDNSDQIQFRPRSPMFPPSPYEAGTYQQHPLLFPPHYPMYPPSMYPPHMQQSPLRYNQSSNQELQDNGIQQQQQYSQQMFLNPYFMNPYSSMYPSIQQQPRLGNNEEQGGAEQVFQVRPSAKKSNVQQGEIDEEKEELEQLIANFQKKRKLNEPSSSASVKQSSQNALNNPKKKQLEHEKQKQQPQQQQKKNIQKQDRNNNNLRLSRNPAKFSSHNQAQPSMILQQQQQQQQMSQQKAQRPSTNNPKGFHENSTSFQVDKALTKEIFDFISDEDRIPEYQFNEVMGYVSQQVKLPKEKLVDFLDQLSGSFKDLKVFLESKQENMLWTKEEDAILEGLKSMDSSEYKLLLKLKGISSIKKRIIYNSIKLPFVVV